MTVCLEDRPIYGVITTTTPDWTGAARSVVQFEDDCYYGFQVTEASVGVVVGLNGRDETAHYLEIEHGLYFTRGTCTIWENGRQRGPSAFGYDEGVRFYIVRIGREVVYCVRPADADPEDFYSAPRYPGIPLPGEVIYLSTQPSYGTVFLDASLYAVNDRIYNEVAGELWYPGEEGGEPDPTKARIAASLPLVTRGLTDGVTCIVDGQLPLETTSVHVSPTGVHALLPLTTLVSDQELNTLIIAQLPLVTVADSGGVYLTMTGVTSALILETTASHIQYSTGVEAELGLVTFSIHTREFEVTEVGIMVSMPLTSFATHTAEGDDPITSGMFASLPLVGFATHAEDGSDPITCGVFASLPLTSFAMHEGDTDVAPSTIVYAELPLESTGSMTYNAENTLTILLSFNDFDDSGPFDSIEITEVLYATTTPYVNYTNLVRDRVRVIGTPRTFYNPQTQVLDVAAATAVLQSALVLSVVEDISAADSITYVQAVQIAEQLRAQGLVETFYHGVVVVLSAIALRDSLVRAESAAITDSLAVEDTLQHQLTRIAELLDAVSIEDTQALVLTVIVEETATVLAQDTLELTAHLLANVIEEAQVVALLKSPADIAQGWVMNTEGTMPISEYDNFDFNGLTYYNGVMYGTSDAGLYQMGADTDEGEPITAQLASMMLDFETSNLKRIRAAYMGYTATNELVLKVRSVADGVMSEHWYKATKGLVAAPDTGRMLVGQKLKSRYWQFEMTNVDGGDFEVDKIVLYPIVLNRRV